MSAPLVDTHTHLYVDDFDGERREAVERAIAAGVRWMIFPNVDLDSVRPMLDLADQYPDHIAVAMGLHPTEVKESWVDDLDAIGEYLDDPSRHYVAIGEIGIDLYWDKTYAEQQMRALERQLQWAVDRDLPVIIHQREGLDQALEVMSDFPTLRGVFHSFGGTTADVERIRRQCDFYFGINGIVTFKNSRLRDTLPAIGIDRLLLETDSPWLAPVPHRGHRNESAYLVDTATHIADSMGTPLDTVAERTTANASALFKFPLTDAPSA